MNYYFKPRERVRVLARVRVREGEFPTLSQEVGLPSSPFRVPKLNSFRLVHPSILYIIPPYAIEYTIFCTVLKLFGRVLLQPDSGSGIHLSLIGKNELRMASRHENHHGDGPLHNFSNGNAGRGVYCFTDIATGNNNDVAV